MTHGGGSGGTREAASAQTPPGAGADGTQEQLRVPPEAA